VPGIWVFILAIFGIIIVIVLVAYFAMRQIQRKRRESLQRRLVSGEIDLEYLGIKRLVVPPHMLSQLPIYIYPDASLERPSSDGGKMSQRAEVSGKSSESIVTDAKIKVDVKTINTSEAEHDEQNEEDISAILQEVMPDVRDRNGCRLTFSQMTCAICLDDYVPGSSFVRELPCMHIFHPECIDAFLMRDGSTCPVCKKDVLPPSFVSDQVTNFMVRREQHMRRVRHHHDREIQLHGSQFSLFDRMQSRARSMFIGSNIFHSRQSGGGDHSPSPAQSEQPSQPEPQVDRRGADDGYDPARREMMQQRAMVLLGQPRPNTDDITPDFPQISRPPPALKCKFPTPYQHCLCF
jgi:hypothetical protein